MHWLASLVELLISEFHLHMREILFHYTLPQVRLLMRARIERNERAEKAMDEKRNKKPDSGPRPEMPKTW